MAAHDGPCVIAKKTRGDRMTGLIRYLFGPGRHEEHRDPRLVAGWEPVPGDGRLTAGQLRGLVEDLDAPRRLHGTQVAGGYVWQCSLRNAADDRVLTDAEWAQVARAAIGELGFAAGCRWVAVRHAEDHIHLAVSLVRDDGRVARTWNDQRVLSRVCAAAERRHGLVVRAQRGGAGMPGLSRAEHERAVRNPGAPPERVALARQVRAAATAATDEADFVRRARAAGLLLSPRWAASGKQEVTGYRVAARADRSSPLLWFGGGRLAPDLTLPRLRSRWPTNDHQTALAEWGKTAGGRHRAGTRHRQEAWAEADRVVDAVSAQLVTVPPEDTATWASAAGNASAALAAAADGLGKDGEGARLATAADHLARCAQRPHADWRRPATRLPGMSGVVRTVSDALIISRGGHAAVAVLLASLGRLVLQIEAAHLAAERAELAHRCRLAAEDLQAHLHSTQAESTALAAGRLSKPPPHATARRVVDRPGVAKPPAPGRHR